MRKGTSFLFVLMLVIVWNGGCSSTLSQQQICEENQRNSLESGPPEWSLRFGLPVRAMKDVPAGEINVILFYSSIAGDIETGASVLVGAASDFAVSEPFLQARKIARFNERLINDYRVDYRTDEPPPLKNTKQLQFKILPDKEQERFIRYYSTLIKGIWLGKMTIQMTKKLRPAMQNWIQCNKKEEKAHNDYLINKMKDEIRFLEWLRYDAREKTIHLRRIVRRYRFIAENTAMALPLNEEILKNPNAILKEWVDNGENLKIITTRSF